MAKIKILIYGPGQDMNGETGIVGVISGREQEQSGYFFARMIEIEGRQKWLGQRFFSDENSALRYWQRQTQVMSACA